MNLKNLKKDRSGVSTIMMVIVVVIILVVAAGAAYVLLSNKSSDTQEDEVPIETVAPGTVLKYNYFDGKTTMVFEQHYVGQNADDYFIKMVLVITPLLSVQSYDIAPKAGPGDAMKTGEAERTTFEGKKTLEIWEYTEGAAKVKAYVNPSNGLSYYVEAKTGTVTETYDLKSYELKWQTSYKVSKSIGKVFEYKGYDADDNVYACGMKCIADCLDGQFGVEIYNLSDGSTIMYYLSDFPQGVPVEAEDMKDAHMLSGTIDGNKMVEKWEYEAGEDTLIFYYDPVSHIVYGFVIEYSDGDTVYFDLSKKP
jgi:hypothetical protein